MEREILVFAEDLLRTSRQEDGAIYSDFEKIEEIHTYTDPEKGYSNFDLILMRISDGSYFKCEITKWGGGEFEYEKEAVQVFPQVRTIITYE